VHPTTQFDLFAASPEEDVPAFGEKPGHENHPLLNAISDIDPDALSPREALDALYRLKQLAGQK
jgi:DNA mismatch repair protein MutS